MCNTVWALRHGERQDKADPNWSKHADRIDDPGMTDRGHKQVERAADRLRGEGIEEIYSSPFFRAVETADHVAEALDLEIKLENGLSEGLKRGRFSVEAFPDLRDRSTLEERFPRIDADYDSRMDPTFPEAFEEYIARNGEAVRRIVAETDAERVLIAGHGATMIGTVAGLTGSKEGIDVPPPLASLTKLTPAGKDWDLRLSGDTSHL